MNGPAVRRARRRAGVPELGLQEQSLGAQTTSARYLQSEAARKRTPGASKQQEPDDEPWHDAEPVVEQPELMRLNRWFKSAESLVTFAASADPAKAASIAVTANILKNTETAGGAGGAVASGAPTEREVQGPAGRPQGGLYRPTWGSEEAGVYLLQQLRLARLRCRRSPKGDRASPHGPDTLTSQCAHQGAIASTHARWAPCVPRTYACPGETRDTISCRLWRRGSRPEVWCRKIEKAA